MTDSPGRPTVAVHRSPHALDPAWDSAFGTRSFFSATPWLRHAHATAATAPYYFTARSPDGDLLAALPAHPLEDDAPYVFCRPDFVLGRNYDAPWTPDLMPALALGGRNPSHGKAAAVDPHALRGLLTTAEEQARDDGMRSVCFLYVDEDDEVLRTALTGAGYTDLAFETTYSLDVPSASDGGFDAYRARFGRETRRRIRRDLRRLEEAGVSYALSPLTDDLIDRIAPLELNLYAKYGTPADADAFRRVLTSVATNTGDTARVLTAELDGRLAGFVLFFTHRGEMYARQTGYDYEAKGDTPLYFGLLYYELLRLAVTEDVTAIHYGTGSGDVKLSRGCTGRAQLAYVKAFDPQTGVRLAELKLADHGADIPA
ncbi:GNAT family N-acetyltransferase [Streptomyces sp. V4I2]|uniref:GNAT family N-acetyltransferase n=1 Tax=Streptomyces sp. V4I2 TaxID=3042280 RepID=UPI0027806ED2|nr:GNAT family N-acetyltransferase [Streptomyces sp. V4I2]MDQ1047718.1 putative N-acyltransferase [Streptomyces sp. V4I2]